MKVVSTARNFNVGKAIEMIKKASLEFEDYGDVLFNSDEERIKVMMDADIVIPAVEDMTEEVFQKCPKIKAISLRGIGYDNIDIDYCHKHNIPVLRSLGALEGTVAEQVIAYIMHFSRQISLQNSYMQNSEWKRIMTTGAKGKTLGIVGFGGIGKEIAKRAIALDMKVVYNCRHPKVEWNDEYSVEYKPFDELLAISDYVAIATPLTNETRNLFNKKTIDKMKNGSVLLNIARGAIIDDDAIVDAIKSGKLSGMANDVYVEEPCTNSRLKGYDNIILTPHTAPFTENTFIEMNELTAQNAIDFAKGEIKDKYLI